jgi:hypothetical protein
LGSHDEPEDCEAKIRRFSGTIRHTEYEKTELGKRIGRIWKEGREGQVNFDVCLGGSQRARSRFRYQRPTYSLHKREAQPGEIIAFTSDFEIDSILLELNP